jgi:hypothetical protein
MDLTRDLASIVDSTLFSKWKQDRLADGTATELFDMLQAFAYTPSKALRERLAMLESAALQVGREDVVTFFKDARKRFDQQFRETR